MYLIRFLQRSIAAANYAGSYFLVLLMLLTVTDVFLRYVFSAPILGTIEFSQFILIIIVWLGLAHTMQVKGHVRVELILSRMSNTGRTYADIFACLINLGLMIIVALANFKLMMISWQLKLFADVTGWLFYPFKGILFIGSVLFCLELLAELFLNLIKLRDKEIMAKESL